MCSIIIFTGTVWVNLNPCLLKIVTLSDVPTQIPTYNDQVISQ